MNGRFKASGMLALALTWPATALAQQRWYQEWVDPRTFETLKRLLFAVLFLFVGWLLAKALSWLVFSALCRTTIDDKIAEKLGLKIFLETDDPAKKNSLERFSARVVFWVLMLFVVIGALDTAGLAQTATPIRRFLDTLVQALPAVGKAIIILIVAYVAGLILQKVVSTALARVQVDERFAEMSAGDGDAGETKPQFSGSAGRVIFWLVMLIGLAGAFEALKIEVVAVPLRNAMSQAILLLPNLATAALIMLMGWVLARIARSVLSNLLSSVGFDRLFGHLELERFMGDKKGSDTVGIAVQWLILFQAATLAIDKLGLDALSASLSGVMDQFWNLLPALVVSAVILTVGVFGGRIVRSLVEGLLDNVGFDTVMDRLGLGFGLPAQALAEGEEAGADKRSHDKPSRLIGFFAQAAVVLVALAQVLENLRLATWGELVYQFLNYTVWHILIALIIVAVGVAIGNYVRDLINARGGDSAASAWTGNAARSAVLVFAATMGIQRLEVAPTFVLLTFALVFGALCLALALAFGLGSREVAAEIVRKQYSKAKQPTPAAPRPPLTPKKG